MPYQIGDDKVKPVDQNVVDQPPPNPPVHQEPDNNGVLPVPNGGDSQNSPSSKLSTKSNSKVSLDGASPLKKSPTVTPESIRENVHIMPIPLPYKKLPDGVVQVKKGEGNNIEEIGDSFPNRYRNKIMENERVKEEEARRSEQAAAAVRIDEAEKDNGAHEELDFPIPAEERIREDPHHINNLGIVDNLRDDVQERAADADQNEQLEEEDGKSSYLPEN